MCNMNNVPHPQKNSDDQSNGNKKTPLEEKLVVLTQKEHIALQWNASFWKTQHSRAKKRESALKQELQQAKAEIVILKQRLFGKKSEKTARDDGGPNKPSPKNRNRGQQPLKR